MNPFIQQIVNQKLNSITAEELVKHGKSYNIHLTIPEAEKIVKILKAEKHISITNDDQHRKIIKKIGKEVNPTLARKANSLLMQFKNK
ncbi:DUF2624 family protein [Bacillus sp. Marseille-P3661]|uniref:DUF2624 family protein n=1 Tax=Bacillus sp. Marseille-P3661 TaxID=1936234 RepID=UPI000C857257|nr:DUF2624 family protein [Bacillus sp. Marseille-P3661]